MTASITSLFWISLVAVLSPLLAGLVPRRLVAEVVLLLGLGVLIGPFGLALAETDEAIELLRELGLALLFLLAGFEIKPGELAGRAGGRAWTAWLVSLLSALAVVWALGLAQVVDAELAMAIALTSTALGTLLPILRDHGLLGSTVGEAVLRHGAVGELGPVLAMTLFLGAGGAVESMLVLLAFAVVAALLTVPAVRTRRGTLSVLGAVRAGAHSTSQTPVRVTVLLLVGLVALAATLELDIVLAAFAAGFILRVALPEGDDHLEARLEGMAFGLLIPVFFVTSGMAIDPAAVVERPGGLVAIVALILVARGLPVLVAGRTGDGMPPAEAAGTALFSATGLPIIVAVTSVAVSSGLMSTENASLLVAAGAVTVLVCPILALTALRRAGHESPAEPPARGTPA